MSLINQMLKDLEARRQQESNVAPHTAKVAPSHPQRRVWSLPRVLLMLLMVLLVGGVAAGSWWHHQKLSQPVMVQQTIEIPVTSTPLVQPPSAPVPPVAPMPETVVDVISVHKQEQQNMDVTPELQVAPLAALPSIPPVVVAQAEPVVREPVRVVVKTPAPLSPLAQAQQMRDQARRLVTQRRYSAAAILFEQALLLDADSPEWWHQVAVIYLRAQQLDAALRVANSGCKLYQNDPLLRVVQARLLVELGKKDQALVALQSIAPPQVRTSSDYYALLATLQQQRGDLVAAEKNYALLTIAFPQRGDWWFGRAICADGLGQRQQATRYFKQALGSRHLKPKLKQYALQQLARLRG